MLMKQVFKKFSWLVCLGMALSLTAFAQNHTVTGTITDDQGEPVVGAAIMVKGTTTGAVTEVDGSYSISVAPDATLLISCIGFKDQTIAVGGNGKINVTLESDAAMLDNAVVIGYGTAKRADVTSSIASMEGETLRQVASGEITHALNGRIAGVQMTQTSSRPGASMEIRIRGTRSLSASNDPLIVLDGVPFMGELSDIATSDIKSMDILKDASATAIYGSRGANGVILITTIKGVSGQKAKVSFNNYVGVKKAIKVPMMNASKYIEMRKAAGKYTNSAFESDTNNTDWQDLFYRNGLVQSHELSVSGGTKKGGYRVGVNYYRDQAVIPTQDYDRFNINGSVDQNITDWLKLGFNTNTNYNRSHGNQLGLYSILQLTPLLSPYDSKGELLLRQSMPNDNVYVLTRKTLENLGEKWVSENNGLATYNNAYIQLSCPWVEGLSFKQTASMNYRKSTSGSFTGVGVNNYTEANPNSASQSNNETKNWALESLLTYDHTFAGKHHVNVVGMYSVEQTAYVQNGMSAKNIPNEQFLYYNIGTANAEDITVAPNNFNYWQAGLQSYMFRAMYTYADRYMISAAVRSDASSRLAKGHQWHTYPAVSIGWNIANEKFMANSRQWVDELKVRAGYGETSNQAINPYQTLGSLGTRPYNFGETGYDTGYYVSTLPNSELGWEYSRTWNFGIDYSFFKGRLHGSIEYYVQNTHDILLNLALPSTAGVGSYTANIGRTSNKGIEFSVNGTIIRKGDWTWTAGLNIYSNKNTLEELASGSKEDKGNQWFVGYPINCIYDFEYDGLWQEGDKYIDILDPGSAPGDIKVKYHGEYNADGSPKRAIDDNDKVPINADPKFLGGFSTTLTWKNLDLTILGNFQCGGVLISTLYGSSGYLNMLSGRRGQVDVDYWTPQNTGARFPRPGGASSNDNPKYGSTLSYFDGGYWKFSTITLGYNFEGLKALKKAGISKLRVYATAQNPFVICSEYTRMSGLDPEPNASGSDGAFQASAGYLGRQRVVGTNTPNTRNFIFGVNFTF